MCINLASQSSRHLGAVFASDGYLKLNCIHPELSVRFTQVATKRMVENIQAAGNPGKPQNLLSMTKHEESTV